LISDWSEWLADEDDPAALRAIRSSTGAGRPLGGKGFLERLEVELDRPVRPRKRGRKPNRTTLALGSPRLGK
jgi:hypothetical protein